MNASRQIPSKIKYLLCLLIILAVIPVVKAANPKVETKNKPEPTTLFPPKDIIIFPEEDRYVPSLIVQRGRISFFWDNFYQLRQDVWGVGVDRSVLLKDIEFQANKLTLKDRQMIWLLHRLGYGMVEFRWSAFGKPTRGMDQMMGFGDPGEAFFVGFRLVWPENETSAILEAQTINFGRLKATRVPWKDHFAKQERFFVIRKKGTVTFIAGSTVLAHFTDSGEIQYVPEIGLEIMAANYSGPPMHFQLIKFDAFADMM